MTNWTQERHDSLRKQNLQRQIKDLEIIKQKVQTELRAKKSELRRIVRRQHKRGIST